MELDLELNQAIKKIQETQAKFVCIQLPDGLKPQAEQIKKELEKNTEANIFIWLGTCFGACDTPNLKNFELLIQFGHSRWK
ncbi:diphthamide synthesis protein [Nanoarchaeota archaeon]